MIRVSTCGSTYRQRLQSSPCDVHPGNGPMSSQFILHVRFLQVAKLWQSTSQAHDGPQSTWPHELSPAQPTLHAPRPQSSWLQEPPPAQSTLQAPAPQVTSAQVSSTVQQIGRA